MKKMDEKKEIINRINKIAGKYSPYEVFTDWIRCSALAMSNTATALDMANVIKDIIRKRMNDGWIPVDERLPEVGEYVLGTTKSGEVLIFRYGYNSPHTRKMFFHLCGAAATIIAWRPLPEPYRPERSSCDEKS